MVLSFFKHITVVAVIFCSCFLAQAQDSTSFVAPKSIIIKMHPGAFFNPTAGLQLGVEYYLKENRTIDFQYRFSMVDWNKRYNEGSDPMYSFLANVGIKFIAKGIDKFYLQPQMQYKQYARFYEESYGTNCDELGCDYFRTFTYFKKQRILSFYGLAGISGEFLNTNFYWDFYGGLGLRFVHSKFFNKPDPDVWTQEPLFREWNFEIGDNSPIDLKVGAAFGYRIKY